MTDRLINSAWWIMVMGLICTVAVAGLFLGYRAMFDFFAGRWDAGLVGIVAGFACAGGTVLLCRHRDELVRF
jgi:hypothetical protein